MTTHLSDPALAAMIDDRSAYFMAIPEVIELVMSLDDPQAWVIIWRVFRCGYALGCEDVRDICNQEKPCQHPTS